MNVKGKVRPQVDGHEHPVYGMLKAGTVMDVDLISTLDPHTGSPALYFPVGVFEPEGWKLPTRKEGDPAFLPEGFNPAEKPAASDKIGGA